MKSYIPASQSIALLAVLVSVTHAYPNEVTLLHLPDDGHLNGAGERSTCAGLGKRTLDHAL